MEEAKAYERMIMNDLLASNAEEPLWGYVAEMNGFEDKTKATNVEVRNHSKNRKIDKVYVRRSKVQPWSHKIDKVYVRRSKMQLKLQDSEKDEGTSYTLWHGKHK